jgi:hypothetical protein
MMYSLDEKPLILVPQQEIAPPGGKLIAELGYR